MKNQNKQICSERRPAFTLVELIVVITILAILGTIAFISLQGYSASARDSKRISDISNIKKSLDLFSLKSGKYPEPDNYNTVAYSGEILWFQGKVGEQVVTNLSRNLNEKPTDPLTDEEYTYSRTYNGKEYELLGLYESDVVSFNSQQPFVANAKKGGNSSLIGNTNAANFKFPRIEGNYNGLYARTANFYLPTPSIINGNVWGNIDFVEDETLIESQVVTGGDNIPGVSTGQLDITLSVYEGIITANSTEEEKIELVEAIQTAYSGSQLANDSIYADILSKTSTGELEEFVDVVVLEVAEYSTVSSGDGGYSKGFSCDEATKPVDNGNINYIIGNPTEKNQPYVQDASNCGYSCKTGYTGTDCATFLVVDVTGGTVSTINVGGVDYKVHKFTSVGTHTLTVSDNPATVEYLVVGGGGGGGSAWGSDHYTSAGGGGGAGGLLTGITTLSVGNHTVVVGAGGVGVVGTTSLGAIDAVGGDSELSGIIVKGGGYGGFLNHSSEDGGSSGGQCGYVYSTLSVIYTHGIGTAESGQGNIGGTAIRVDGSSSSIAAGGGGGAGGIGSSGIIGSGGNGGIGVESNITGTSKTYGVGGKGGYSGLGGVGSRGIAGASNTGNGGGGASRSWYSSEDVNGSSGGSGIVVIRYLYQD